MSSNATANDAPAARAAPHNHGSPQASSEASGRSAGDSGTDINAEERRQMIAVAAYYRAECRGFAPGCELDDWLAAEAEIERQVRAQSD